MADVRSQLVVNRAQLQQVLTGPQSAAVQGVSRLQRRVLATAKMRSPVRYGVLRNSHVAEPIRVTGMKVSTSVSATANYARAVHEGTRPHVIRPNTAKVLSWQGPRGRIFAREVLHPGTRPRPWLRLALNEEAGRLGFTVGQ